MARKKVLMTRFGGIGDSVMLTGIAAYLADNGFYVRFCVPEKQVELFTNLTIFDKVEAIKRLPNLQNGRECLKVPHGYAMLDKIKEDLHKKNWLIADFKHMIENNSMWGGYPYNQFHGYWTRTMNSNYQNWYDIAFSWINVDPTKVPAEYKRPFYAVEKEEADFADSVLPDDFIAVNLSASSLARAIYHQHTFVDELLKAGHNILHWNENHWEYRSHDGNYSKDIKVKSVRESAALVSRSKLFVSTDSGLSHIAEALGVKQLTIYTTVPAWTRMKYYRHSTALESGVHCSPCFVIGRFCPIIEHDVEANKKGLTERERQVLEMSDKKIPPEQAAMILNTSPEGLNLLFDTALKKKEHLKNAEPECIKSITPERLMKGVESCLHQSS